MAPEGLRCTEHHRRSGLLARTHNAGTHRSRVPRCGAGPPVWTGPPAPASRSPWAHTPCSLHGRAGCEAWLTQCKRRQPYLPPQPRLPQTGLVTSPLGAERTRPPPLARALQPAVPLTPTLFVSVLRPAWPPHLRQHRKGRSPDGLPTPGAAHCLRTPRRTQSAKLLGSRLSWAHLLPLETHSSCKRAQQNTSAHPSCLWLSRCAGTRGDAGGLC